MREHPILFQTEMVQAILEGRKTQTRRVVKPQPADDGLWNDDKFPRSLQSTLTGWNGTVDATGEDKEFKCPYGKVGDILWVRETWRKQSYSYADTDRNFSEFQYKASWPKGLEKNVLWKPSIFMPKSACRIFLEITGIRVERLQDISEDDAIAEGIEDLTYGEKISFKDYGTGLHPLTPVASYKSLWQSINGEESWNQNQLVWVIQFKRINK